MNTGIWPEEFVVEFDISATGCIGLKVQIEVLEAAANPKVLAQLVDHERIRLDEQTAVIPKIQGECEQGQLSSKSRCEFIG